MKEYLIDLSGVYTPDDLYDRLEEQIGLPEYFGCNLDALHDVWTECGEETAIHFINTAEAEVMMSKYMRNLQRMAARVCEENPRLQVIFS